VDFLGKERNRLLIVLAFGATASSCFEMFYETLTGYGTTGISQHIPNTPYGKGTYCS